MEKQEEIEIKNLDHLGIVAGLIDELEIEKIVDQKLGKDTREKISAGKVVKALILNRLGMVSRPLYLFSQFWEDKAIEKLLGKGVKKDIISVVEIKKSKLKTQLSNWKKKSLNIPVKLNIN